MSIEVLEKTVPDHNPFIETAETESYIDGIPALEKPEPDNLGSSLCAEEGATTPGDTEDAIETGIGNKSLYELTNVVLVAEYEKDTEPPTASLSIKPETFWEDVTMLVKRIAQKEAYAHSGYKGHEDFAGHTLEKLLIKEATCRRILAEQGPKNLSNYIYRILKNNVTDDYRRSNIVRIESSDDMTTYNCTEAGPDETVVNLALDGLRQAIDKSGCPEIFLTAVMLCDVEGYSYDEIAKIMGCQIGTVRSRIHRGRAILRNSPSMFALLEARQNGS